MTPMEIRRFADQLDAERDDMPPHLKGDISAAVIQLHYIAAVLTKEGRSGTATERPTPNQK